MGNALPRWLSFSRVSGTCPYSVTLKLLHGIDALRSLTLKSVYLCSMAFKTRDGHNSHLHEHASCSDNIFSYLPRDVLHRIAASFEDIRDILAFRASCASVKEALDVDGW